MNVSSASNPNIISTSINTRIELASDPALKNVAPQHLASKFNTSTPHLGQAKSTLALYCGGLPRPAMVSNLVISIRNAASHLPSAQLKTLLGAFQNLAGAPCAKVSISRAILPGRPLLAPSRIQQGVTPAQPQLDLQRLLAQSMKNIGRFARLQKSFAARLDGVHRQRNDVAIRVIRSAGFGKGEPVSGKAPESVSVQDILNDPSLSFEDMLFMVFSKIMKDMQSQVSEELKQIESKQKALKAKGDKGTGQSKSEVKSANKGVKNTRGQVPVAHVSHQRSSAFGRRTSPNKPFAKLIARLVSRNPVAKHFLKAITSKLMPLSSAIKLFNGNKLNLARIVKKVLPMAMPLIQKALMAVPVVGPFLAMMAPKVLPQAVGLLNLAMKSDSAASGKQEFAHIQGSRQQGMASQGPRTSDSTLVGGQPKAGSVQHVQEGTSGLYASTEKPKGHGDSIAKLDDTSASLSTRMERLKLITSRLERMQTLFSNIMSTIHRTQMNTIRNIKG